jgi:hypothetical protein
LWTLRFKKTQKFFIINASQNISRDFFVTDVFNKNAIFNVLLMIKFTFLLHKSSGFQRHPIAPTPPPPPPGVVAGGGGKRVF